MSEARLIPLPTRRATRELAKHLADELAAGDLVVLSGALGAGKTFLIRGVCRALNVPRDRRVTSPTFSLIHEYRGRVAIAHSDLYRLADPRELDQLGLFELRDAGYLLLVEWGEPYVRALGGDALIVTLELDPRRAHLVGTGSRSQDVARAVLARYASLDAGPSAG